MTYCCRYKEPDTASRKGPMPSIAREDIGIETLRRMSALDAYNRWIMGEIRPWIGKVVLEAGAGIGNLSPFFLDAERLILTDRDERCLASLREKFAAFPQVTSERFDLEGEGTQFHERGIDTVVALNVMEHIEHDEHALAEFAALLKPGGRVILQIPAHRLLYGTLDRNLDHFRRYGVHEIREKFIRAGLVPELTRRMNIPGVIGWLVCSRLLKKDILPEGSLGLFNRLTPLFIAVEKVIPAPVGLSIIAVGRKPD
jgi:2-polyprenyl-3-methyl-5-hydroxy-6-metoxy-1,4-benzoquinol methylase